MYREFGYQMEIVANANVQVFSANVNRRFWWPYRLQRYGEENRPIREESLELIFDSAIGNDDVTNEDVLDVAHDMNADWVFPSDVMANEDPDPDEEYIGKREAQERTTERVFEFLETWESHPCRAKPMIPLQPPWDEHIRKDGLDGFPAYGLGGTAFGDWSAQEQVDMAKDVRDEIGSLPWVHGLGMGASLDFVRAVQDDPTLFDSVDMSSIPKYLNGGRIPGKDWKPQDFAIANGKNTSTIHAGFSKDLLLHLSFMLGPFCWDDLLDDVDELDPETLRDKGQVGFETFQANDGATPATDPDADVVQADGGTPQ